ncbi:DUF2162 domain-containing protein [Desulfobulbus rhabdoformis]|uniref:DUF2162 family putative transporter n=1 Tax=Desulfobulbus rhabdoformis TaxID=34032 RepID=UPI0019639EBA|nr:DUF2162 family putative transporter [Desulfobulbus rhabdoformis]MBM9614821.1 DUF2162 domain-containing protein [Desulfobulbus rhabdoformis]
MIYKSLIMGVLFSIGIFAGKSGIGMAYLIGRKNNTSLKAKLTKVLAFSLFYALFFALIGLGLHVLDPLAHFASIQSFLRSGMQVHLILAAVMVGWGLLLIRRPHEHNRAASRGWLLLTLPCPVCATVIIFSIAFCLSLFPDQFPQVVGGLYLAFLGISLVSMGIMLGIKSISKQSAESLLGSGMLLLGIYFLISMAVLPQFSDIDKIYRLAQYHVATHQQSLTSLAPVVVLTLLTFTAGFGHTFQKIRSSR